MKCIKISLVLLLTVIAEYSVATEPSTETVANAFVSIQSRLRKNTGQWDKQILFQSFSSGRTISFLEKGLSFAVTKNTNAHNQPFFFLENNFQQTQTLVYNLVFEGTNTVPVNGEGSKESKCNYLLGADKNNYVVNAKDYDEIYYKNIYNQIDLKYYFNDNLIEYDYVVNRGADVSNIKMRFEGVEKITITKSGDLHVHTPWGLHIEKKPFAYQIINGIKKEIAVNYSLLQNNSFGFVIQDKYNTELPLIIDPVILDWSTYAGSGGNTECWINDLALDALGFVYVTGRCRHAFPVTVGTYNGGIYDGFVMKMQPNGSGIVWATYIGGNATDSGNGIAVNGLGESFICGTTSSNNFPLTAGAIDNVFNYSMPYNISDAFVLKLDPSGTTIIYSTFLGGEACGEVATCIDLSGTNEVVVGGNTNSPDFPITTGAYDPICIFAKKDGFISRIHINPTGGAHNPSNLLYSTFIGGDAGNESVTDIKFGNGHIYFTGIVFMPNYPLADFPTTSGSFDDTFNADHLMSDGFVCRINPAGGGISDLVYSTYIGAPATWMGIQQRTMSNGIALSPNNPDVVYVVGQAGGGFPVTSVSPPYSGGQGDVFVIKLSMDNNNTAPDFTDLLASRYMGGPNQDSGFDIAVDSDEEVFVTGKAQVNFPVTCGAYQPNHNNNSDVFVAKLDNTLNILYSTYIGGSSIDFEGTGEGHSIALFGSGCKEEVVVAGSTQSNDFPTTSGAFQTTKLNNAPFFYQGFIFKLADKTGTLTPDFTLLQTPTDCGAIVEFNFIPCIQSNPSTHQGWNPISTWNWSFGDGAVSTTTNPSHIYTGSGNYSITLTVGNCPGTITKTISISNGISLNINPASAKICEGDSLFLNATVSGYSGSLGYTWATILGTTAIGTNSLLVKPIVSTTYSVIVSTVSGCTAQAVSVVSVNPIPIITVTSDTVCFGKTAVLAASGADAYNWMPGGFSATTYTAVGESNMQFTVTGIDFSSGCKSSSVSAQLIVHVLPDAKIVADKTKGCAPLCVDFSCVADPSQLALWKFGDGTFASNETKVNHCFQVSGIHGNTLTIIDKFGCESSSVHNVEVYPKPVADFIYAPLKPLVYEEVQFTDASHSAIINKWDWYFTNQPKPHSNEQHPSFSYLEEKTYPVALIVTSNHNCKDTLLKTIIVVEEDVIFVPNAFTPNGDGINDVFQPKGVGINGYKLQIFDRWGVNVFSSGDFNTGWDGTYKQQEIKEDVYVWKINFTNAKGKSKEYTGHVVLYK